MYLSVLKRYMFLISMKLCYNFLDKHQLLIMECLSVLKLSVCPVFQFCCC